MSHYYTGWTISDDERANLLAILPPSYPDVLAHHITHTFPATKETPLPVETTAEIIGVADNGVGVQALVVSINGTTERPDGKIFHLTWSLDRASGFRPNDSNKVILDGWSELPLCVPITITPTLMR